MSSWSAGYIAEVGYTYGYFNELNPLNAKLALLDAGVACPEFQSACELGFGQGLSVNIHAAGASTKWYGTDFSPSQAGFAQTLAHQSENKAQLFDQSFAEFAAREDLPDFDFIGLHGTWTWISNENRKILVDFISRKLKVGGVLYISYNTQAGWANMMPIRHLLNEYARLVAAPGDNAIDRLQEAMRYTEQFLATQPGFLKANPQVSEIFKRIKEYNPNYLAHEYLGMDWDPMPFSQLSDWLTEAKLDYVCSAFNHDLVDALNLTEDQQTMLSQQSNVVFRETLRDLCVNQHFRKDYWVKGAQRLDRFEQMENMMALRFVMAQLPDEFDFKVVGALGELNLKRETYQPIVEFFADFEIKTLGQLAQAMQTQGIGLDKVLQAVQILTGKGTIQLAQNDVAIEQAKAKTDKLNQAILKKARASEEIVYLASPVTGGGILIQGYEMLFMLAQQFGQTTAEQMAQFSWGLLKNRGVQLERDGQTLESDADNLALLTEQAAFFLQQPLKLYQALGIV